MGKGDGGGPWTIQTGSKVVRRKLAMGTTRSKSEMKEGQGPQLSGLDFGKEIVVALPTTPINLLMNIGSWNIRSFNKGLKEKGVVNLFQTQRHSILRIIETKFTTQGFPNNENQEVPTS